MGLVIYNKASLLKSCYVVLIHLHVQMAKYRFNDIFVMKKKYIYAIQQ